MGEQASLEFDLTVGDVLLHNLFLLVTASLIDSLNITNTFTNITA